LPGRFGPGRRRVARCPGSNASSLDARIGQLEELEQQRGRWLAHTAGTRAAAERAALELANRRAVDEHTEPRVAAAEGLTAHHDAERVDEAHREITPTDLNPTDVDSAERECGLI
jgi:hypothetical protein